MLRRHRWLPGLALLLLGPALSSCSGGRQISDPSLVAALRRSRDLWASRSVDDYRYTLQVSCFCTEQQTRPVVIEVRNGVRSSVTYAGTDVPADPALFTSYDSVEKIFALLEREINRPADRLTVVYDPAYGYPTDVSIDPSQQIADEELGLTVRSFQITR